MISISEDTNDETQCLRFTRSLNVIYYPTARKARLSSSTRYEIYGLMLEALTLTSRTYYGDLSHQDCERFMKEIRKMPLKELDAGPMENGRTRGWFQLDGKSCRVTAAPHLDVSRKWVDFFDEGLMVYAPADGWRVDTRTIEGECVKPRELDFATFLTNPALYDGKRIALRGYYHHSFENSSLAPSMREIENPDRCIWLSGMARSAMQDCGSFDFNDTAILVEGTYDFCGGRAGHMGGWLGEMVRMTTFQPIVEEDFLY